MKSTIMKINIMLLGCFLSVAIVNAQGPSAIYNNTKQADTETKATSGKYTGHWFIKSGDEFYLVRSGNLPPGLVKKTTDNKVEDIDVEGVKRAVNFRQESNINGKPVDNYYFVIEEEGEGNSASLHPTANDAMKSDNNSIDGITAEGISNINKSESKPTDGIYTLTYAYCTGSPADYKICAIQACYGFTNIGWAVYNSCVNNTSSGNVCLAYKVGMPLISPYYYYVACGTTN
jgi:hypothetical protein